MREELKELWRFRFLLWQLVRRDLKVRYKNSRLGFLWSIAPPLMQVAVITFVFKKATNFAQGIDSYSAFLLAAMIPWSYLNLAILDSSQSILLMYGVIKKVYLPREIIPLANAISNFIHFLLSWGVFFIFWWGIQRQAFLPTTFWFPYLVIVQFLLVTGLCLFVAALNVFYEDVKYIVTILLQLGLFLFPIMYLSETVLYKSDLGKLGNPATVGLFLYNPVTALINGYRKCLLEPPHPRAFGGHEALPLDVPSLLLTGVLSLLVFLGGYAYFNKRKWQFVERP